MLNEPHYPSKWSVVIVFLVLALIMVGVFAWAFYFNLGTILVSADQPFSLSVNGEDHDCSSQSCEVSLPPAEYDFTARVSGFYDESFSLEVSRGQNDQKELSFQLIPYLKRTDEASLPAASDDAAWFQSQGAQLRLMAMRDGEEQFIVAFDTLVDPQVSAGGNLAVIVDEGRVFFVDLKDGRRQRRFDDSVTIQAAQVSDNGERVLLFVNTQDRDQLWLWYEGLNEMRPQAWYSPSALVKWDAGTDHRIFVFSDQLVAPSQVKSLEDLFENAQPTNPSMALFRYNFDTETPTLLSDHGEQQPLLLDRRGERYFVELEEGEWSELVVR